MWEAQNKFLCFMYFKQKIGYTHNMWIIGLQRKEIYVAER